jgi:hypothetical protein
VIDRDYFKDFKHFLTGKVCFCTRIHYSVRKDEEPYPNVHFVIQALTKNKLIELQQT